MIGSFLDDESIPETSKTIKQSLILFEILSAWGTHLYWTLSNCKVSKPRIFYVIIPHKTTPLTSLNPLRT